MIAFLTRTRAHAIAFAAFIALVWLNQSVGGTEWEALRDRTFAAQPMSAEHAFDLVRYPFIFLYRRSGDEAIYFETASATLGLPYDTSVFAQRGDSPLPPVATAVDGKLHVPYAEVPFEYPPPNVPFVLLPRLLVKGFATYAYLFGAIMGLLLVSAGIVGARLGASGGAWPPQAGRRPTTEHDEATRIFGFGLLLLAHGAIAVQRLDAIVALLVVLMVRAARHGDDRALGFWGGLVGAAKLVPFLLLPVLVLAGGIRDRKRLAAVTFGATLGLVLGLGPMVVLGRASLPLLLTYHSARGLHVESSFGVLYGAVKAMAGMREASTMDYGSFNFHGPVSKLLAKSAMAVTLALVALVGYAAHRGAGPRAASDEITRTERLVLAALATLTALWLGGKVFSPQYLTWAIPLAVAVPGRTWRLVALGLGVVLALSQLYLRGFYDHVYNQWPAGVLTMLVRLAVLIASFVLLVRAVGGWRRLVSPSSTRVA
jgi:hypothetical protein